MVAIRYFAGLEQLAPSFLLDMAVLAEQAGFDGIACSDHFHPWAHTNAQAGFAWAWVASAAERTKRMNVGTAVTSPLFRYHPGIVAQAFATLGEMYPGRIFVTLGTGEALNECPLGYPWPSRRERIERLEEAITIIKRLWTEQFVTFKGKYYTLRKANLYTKPKRPVKLYVAAQDTAVVELAGKCTDGLDTMFGSVEHCKNVILPAFEKGARAAGRNPDQLQKVIHFMVSYHEDYDAALARCHIFGGVTLPVFFKYKVYDPREIELHGRKVAKEELAKTWIISTNPEEHLKRIEEYVKIGFTDVEVHNISPDERTFIKVYGEKVLPYLKEEFND